MFLKNLDFDFTKKQLQKQILKGLDRQKLFQKLFLLHCNKVPSLNIYKHGIKQFQRYNYMVDSSNLPPSSSTTNTIQPFKNCTVDNPDTTQVYVL